MRSTQDVIYALIREMARQAASDARGGDGDGEQLSDGTALVGGMPLADVYERCAAKGYRREQVDLCLDLYENMHVWQLNTARTRLTIVA